MAAADVQQPPAEPVPALPDYLASPNATLGDLEAQWRYGKPPDYSKTRKVWEDSKQMNHTAGSLPQLVENLVKNWEVEASFKSNLADWRTIDHANYTFAINGGPPQSAEYMLKVGTYNAIIAPNEYYSPNHSDFASSHKTFKRMMPTFAWEVLEVYSGPPKVSFRWRHWGEMKNDYVGFNDKGEKITAKSHGGTIDIQGVTVAQVDEKVRLQSVETWFDPLEMFRQIAPGGIVNKEVLDKKVDSDYPQESAGTYARPVNDGVTIAQEHNGQGASEHSHDLAPEEVLPKHISESTGQAADAFVPHQGADTKTAAEDSNEAYGTTWNSAIPAGKPPVANDAFAVVESAAAIGTSLEMEKPASNFAESPTQPCAPRSETSDGSWERITRPTSAEPTSESEVKPSQYSSSVTGDVEKVLGSAQNAPTAGKSMYDSVFHDAIDDHLESSSADVQPHPHHMEEAVKPHAGEAVATPAQSAEARATYEEMSNMTPAQCPFLMNRE